ncbi:hypothetical protein GCT13_07180 [Paraburkholderia sp. CNPSo 3157]|uniref:Uncharacterized protein n=1 Tax=Paraburkholderia franconis TaxID=2654983 RepID=A0A7X1TEV8_9BURK|nr:hypothetical protein [Paraburkholderia franconis]MPW16723.1 hypothetical protein [Paraburkholderia franconis]
MSIATLALPEWAYLKETKMSVSISNSTATQTSVIGGHNHSAPSADGFAGNSSQASNQSPQMYSPDSGDGAQSAGGGGGGGGGNLLGDLMNLLKDLMSLASQAMGMGGGGGAGAGGMMG